jgi:hypothetical protein
VKHIERAEAGIRLHGFRIICRGFVESSFAEPGYSGWVQGKETEGIERTEPQRLACKVFGDGGVPAEGVDIRAEIKCGSTGTVQRERTGDRPDAAPKS